METSLKTCNKCGRGYTGEGNNCYYCKNGKTRKKKQSYKGLCYTGNTK